MTDNRSDCSSSMHKEVLKKTVEKDLDECKSADEKTLDTQCFASTESFRKNVSVS